MGEGAVDAVVPAELDLAVLALVARGAHAAVVAVAPEGALGRL